MSLRISSCLCETCILCICRPNDSHASFNQILQNTQFPNPEKILTLKSLNISLRGTVSLQNVKCFCSSKSCRNKAQRICYYRRHRSVFGNGGNCGFLQHNLSLSSFVIWKCTKSMYCRVVPKFPFLPVMAWLSFHGFWKEVSVGVLTSVQHLEEQAHILLILKYSL